MAAESPQPTTRDCDGDLVVDLLEHDASRRGVLRELGAAGTVTVASAASSGTAIADSIRNAELADIQGQIEGVPRPTSGTTPRKRATGTGRSTARNRTIWEPTRPRR